MPLTVTAGIDRRQVPVLGVPAPVRTEDSVIFFVDVHGGIEGVDQGFVRDLPDARAVSVIVG